MLLAVQTEGTHESTMPKTSKKVLFTMWPRRSPNQGMSSATGKRQWGRGSYGRGRNLDPLIRFIPRPHTKIKIRNKEYDALIDGGSEISIINQDTAWELAKIGFEIQEGGGLIQLADGSEGETSGSINLLIRLRNRTTRHEFFILPKMEDEILIGIDLQAKLQIGIPPPPKNLIREISRCLQRSQGAGSTDSQRERRTTAISGEGATTIQGSTRGNRQSGA